VSVCHVVPAPIGNVAKSQLFAGTEAPDALARIEEPVGFNTTSSLTAMDGERTVPELALSNVIPERFF
jgi:hypothetical protein